MEEKILIYKRYKSYDEWMGFMKFRTQELQSIVDSMKSLQIATTKENLKKLLNGEELTNISVHNDIEKHLGFLPERLKSSLIGVATKELQEKYDKVLGDKVKAFIFNYKAKHIGVLSLKELCDKIDLIDGRVLVSKDCLEWIDKLCSVYVDSSGRKAVYDAYLRFMDALNALEIAVEDAPKKPNIEYMGQIFGHDHNTMKAFGAEETNSVVKLIDGNIKIDGNIFDHIQ